MHTKEHKPLTVASCCRIDLYNQLQYELNIAFIIHLKRNILGRVNILIMKPFLSRWFWFILSFWVAGSLAGHIVFLESFKLLWHLCSSVGHQILNLVVLVVVCKCKFPPHLKLLVWDLNVLCQNWLTFGILNTTSCMSVLFRSNLFIKILRLHSEYIWQTVYIHYKNIIHKYVYLSHV